ncbi:MAG: hypothetical protein HKN16_00200 [Saprospiraceae bacterium]|nr:hypothetical protein [Saprospiraceae bacterium]
MRNIFVFLFALSLVGLWSCSDDDTVEATGDLKISYNALFDGQELIGNQEYTLPDGKKIRFTQFNFLVSDMMVDYVEESETKITDLSPVEFVELTQTGASPLEPSDNQFTFFNLPTGEYTGIGFTFGLNDELNLKTPADQDLGDNSPLKKSSHYWAGWQSYIYMKMEGTIDMNDDGMLDTENENFAYHTGAKDGSNTAATIYLPYTFNVEENSTTDISMAIDLRDVLYNASGQENWPIATRPTTHNPDDFDLVQIVMEKASEAFKMGE